MRLLITLAAALGLAGCLLDPEKKKDKVITVDCRDSFDRYDSTDAAHFRCPIKEDPKPPAPQ
jgi:hypothetical protein